jgi:hypothetical protein
MRNYILEGHDAIPCDDLRAWGQWFQNADRRVAYTDVTNNVSVSTVFLGMDHSFRNSAPVLFETMVFGLESYVRIYVSPGDINHKSVKRAHDLDGTDCWRYSTWEEAEEGHFKAVEEVRRRLGME